jgi:predicted ribosomally synthesized peptide with SipW-like signal peptide
MLNKKMLLSVLVIGCIATVASAGTWAYFSDTETSTGNTFAAGTLDMSLSDDNENGGSVVATWKSPENYKPGDTFENTLKFTNTGTIDAHHIYFYTEGLLHNANGDSSNLMNDIIITSIMERFNGVTTTNYAPTIEQQVGNRDGVLTLAEFCNWRAGYYTFDDQSHLDDDVIAGGDQQDYDFILGFKFDENADNTYQGDNCGFDLRAVATQNSPTDGMVKLHA